MVVPANYTLIRKDVKHARVRVSEDHSVRLIIPLSFTSEDIDSLIKQKQRWINKNQRFFEGKSKIDLQRNQLLLFGNRYSYFHDSTFKNKVIVDHSFKTVRASRNLLDNSIQKKWYRNIAAKHLKERTAELAKKPNFKYNQVFIRDQRSKLGNCSKDRNISLNWRLVKAPQLVIDYLIIHELVHTVEMSHTTKFWTLLKSHYPDYKGAIKWLDKYSNSL